MRVRGGSLLATCRNIKHGDTILRRFALRTGTCNAVGSQWSIGSGPGVPRRLFVRGAKSKTVVKLRDLPQGPLPSLLIDDADEVPAKSYPRTLQQHLDNIRRFPDTIVLTRVGDFYEMYFDQVDQYAHLVGLKKAKRKTSLGNVAMAGFQHWHLERYLKMFMDLGKQVAISEQVPIAFDDTMVNSKRSGMAMYDRKVSRIVTPGTLIDESFLEPLENSYLLAVIVGAALPDASDPVIGKDGYERYKRTTPVGLSWVDLTSGEFYTQLSSLASLPSLVARIAPKELLLGSHMEHTSQSELQALFGDGGYSVRFHNLSSSSASVADWSPMLERAVSEEQHADFTSREVVAGDLVLDYVREKLQGVEIRLQPPIRRSDDDCMVIDSQSLRGLEIRSRLRDGAFKGSLLHSVRRTITRSGARLLNQRLASPSMSIPVINSRLDLVQEMISYDGLREDILALLGQTSDTYRVLQRFSLNRGDADDMLGLAKTIQVMGQVSELLHAHITRSQTGGPGPADYSACWWLLLERLDLKDPNKVAKAILKAIDEEGLMRRHALEDDNREEAMNMTNEVEGADASGEEPPAVAKRVARSKSATRVSTEVSEDIWVMRPTASQTLQSAHQDLISLVEQKQELTSYLRLRTNTSSLTLQWSPKIGYFCHVKGKDVRANLDALEGMRSIGNTKSTRSFTLPEWRDLGEMMDSVKLRIRVEEERVFTKLRALVIENLMKLRRNAAVLDELDVAYSSATVAKERNLIRPILQESTYHNIIAGRHPTVDVGLSERGRLFTANDCTLGIGGKEKIYLITGPNMGGKSTYLRQNALITVLAQTGCFVPAEYAEIGLVDKVFSRVGSADNLYQDQSTFMVEMVETAQILQQATERSLVIMDEVGRGTTPEDGLAVGYACLHYLHERSRCRALFATHFHALADMTASFESVGYYCTDVQEGSDGSWTYLHRLRKGVNRKSHALKVAKLAGLPEEAISVASDVLRKLEIRPKRDSHRDDQFTTPVAAFGCRYQGIETAPSP